MQPPFAPPAPAAVVQRQRRKRFDASLYEAAEVHELHGHLRELTEPWREAFQPVTVLCAGRTQLDQRCVVMNPRQSSGLRSIFASWVKEMAGDGPVTLAASTAELGADAAARHGETAGPCDVAEAIQALEAFVASTGVPSFVAVKLGLQRYMGNGASFWSTALWIDLSVDEILKDGPDTALQQVKAFLETGEVAGPQPLLEALLPTLQGEQALKLVICGPSDDPAIGAARARLSPLLAASSAASECCLELNSLLEVQPAGIVADLLVSAFQDLRCTQTSSLSEFLTGEVCLKDFGFPGHVLPKLPMKYKVTNYDRVKLHLAAESAMEDFEAHGWISGSSSGVRSSLHLADCYDLPPEVLTTSSARTFARSQDPSDPLVHTIHRIREDVAFAIALLPLCATHPFNMIRVLQLGGIHSLLALLADSSSLAPRDGGSDVPAELLPVLSAAEVSAMVLMVLCASRAIRHFLVSQGIFELLAVAIRYPSSSRQLQIFCALLVRLLRDPELRPKQLGPPLAAQLADLLERPEETLCAQAVAAASAALSPCLSLEAFAPLLPQLLRNAAPEAFKALCASLTLALESSSEVQQLNVPRLLSLMPVDPPKGIHFHHGACCALALCSKTAAMTSLCRPWVVSTGMAMLRSLMAGGQLKELRIALPLAKAPEPRRTEPPPELSCEVEEKLRMKRTFGSTWRTATPPDDAAAAAGGAGTPALRRSRLLGLARRWPRKQLATSPNAAEFQEMPQLRLEVFDDHTELFLGLSLLPVCKCSVPHEARSEGQMGFWICECPEDRKDQHQLALKAAVHISASQTETEHLVSVALPRGLYTVVPFSSHQIPADYAERIKTQCRRQMCGCVDLNLHQQNLYDSGTSSLFLSIWGEATEMSIQMAKPWFQRLRLRWPWLTSLPVWLCPKGDTEVLICVTGIEDDELSCSEVCLDLWPSIPHQRVRNERTGALRIHIPRLSSHLRLSCLWQEPHHSARRRPQLLIYSAEPLEAYCPRPDGQPPPRQMAEMPRPLQNYWQSSVLCAGSWTSGFSSGLSRLRNPQVVLEVLRGPSRGEELQLEIYLCIPMGRVKDKETKRPKASFTVFVRQEEPSDRLGAPERLAEGVLRRELARAKTAVGTYVMTSLNLCGAESRQQLYIVLQNDAAQETWPWQLWVLARIRAKDGESAGQAGCSQPMGIPEEPPLRFAVLGGWAEAGRIYTCWPEGVACYTPKPRNFPVHRDDAEGRGTHHEEHLTYAWREDEDWSYEAAEVHMSSGSFTQQLAPKGGAQWPSPEPLLQVEAGEELDVTTVLVPPKVQVDPEDAPERPQTLAQRDGRKLRAVPPPPKRLVLRSNDDGGSAPTAPDTPREPREPETPWEPPSQQHRKARMEQLLRRRKHGRERIMPEEFYREAIRPGRQEASSLPPRARVNRGDAGEACDGPSPGAATPARPPGAPVSAPRSARGAPRSASPARGLPPIEQEQRCCNFAGHPIFCCRGTAHTEHEAARRHLVRLDRGAPGQQRLGFGNVVAGPPHAPVLIISWIRQGALAEWNASAPEGMAVPVQSAIVSVNGISGNVQKMREALRSQEVDLEVLAPERWRYPEVTRSA